MEFKNATEVRNNFQDTVDFVHYTKEPIVVTRRNKPWVMIVHLPEDQTAIDKALEKYLKVSEESK